MRSARMRTGRFAAGVGALAACAVALACWGAAGAQASAPDPGPVASGDAAGAAQEYAAPADPGVEGASGSGEMDLASSGGAASDEAAPLSASQDAEAADGEGGLAASGDGAEPDGEGEADGTAGEPAADPEASPVGDPAEGVEEPAAKVAVGPWFARFDAGAVDRAQAAAADAFAQGASLRAGLSASLLAAVGTMCAAAGAACLIVARTRLQGASAISRDARARKPAYATMPERRPVVTRRKEV